MVPFLFSEEFLSVANSYFLQAEIAAAILLGIGIVYESDKYPLSVHASAFWFVVIGVVLETVFSILLFASEERIGALQRDKIIALETKLAPRHFGREQAQPVRAVLEKLGDVRIDLLVFVDEATPDTRSFGNNIYAQLLAGRKNVKYWNVRVSSLLTHIEDIAISPAFGNLAPENQASIGQAVSSLITTFNAVQVKATWGPYILDRNPPGTLTDGPAWDENDIAPIRIMVGTKPD